MVAAPASDDYDYSDDDDYEAYAGVSNYEARMHEVRGRDGPSRLKGRDYTGPSDRRISKRGGPECSHFCRVLIILCRGEFFYQNTHDINT